MCHVRHGGSWLGLWEHLHQVVPLCAPFSPGAQSQVAMEELGHQLSSGASHSLSSLGDSHRCSGISPEAVTSEGITELCTSGVWRVGIPASEGGSNAALEIHESSIAAVQIRRRRLEV